MKNRRKANPRKIIGTAVLVALLACVGVLGVRVAKLVNQTSVEMRTTPTPEPVGGNVMAVTIDPSAPTPEPMLRTGSQGDEVKQLQGRLHDLNYYTGEIDGQFGAGTRDAVILFQTQNGLDADGVVGSETRALLYSAQAKQATSTATPAPSPTAAPGNTANTSGDAGLPLLVNKTHPVSADDQPQQLVNMTAYCDPAVVKIKAGGIQGEKVAVDALMAMLRTAVGQGVAPWQVSAGYRSVAYQQQLFDEKVAEFEKQGFSHRKAISATRKTVADPGTSEHHTGLAFDITVPGKTFKGTAQADWLAENCWDWGFVIRYQEGKEDITGFVAEPWHIRYVGEEPARRMREENLCLEEYVQRYGAA